ncbi:MAG: DUF4381 domain-containing protein [Thiotrichales bacterium]|nr:DUF4381 domain-containing protein [Thiotrichales bacterium]
MNEILLDLDIRDIHVPEDVSWWPLASGWWLLFLSILVVVYGTCYLYRRGKGRRSLRAVAHGQLREIRDKKENTSECFTEVYLLLRRISKVLPEGEMHLKMDNDQWLEWLSSLSGMDSCPDLYRRQVSRIPYQPPQHVDTAEFIEFAAGIISGIPDRPAGRLSYPVNGGN